ncbi:hypothetical protein E3P77_02986 [Wallemia ichthyophaga]|uniref:Eukaryotic translation initiation factor 3 subunit E n=1 Tax=Wallemia ichthyophaga TaxID=245174 RepID=A0A4T0K7R9_WALIC|nr:hypothetical protein E3P91_02796 [Wallemia ichthyophaga]TIA80214.1 hypothetical protein E3P98_02818 [Wallemia ichthyophaga]TIA89401.1 hypothetical protein E3P97_03072 [Wallemia ichthyophaga]TIA97679.1 hypothetical protein E3P95_02786 [Wallemia ichthyophaga]TIA98805.1 hypothetical protein E3P94_02795 [Wallemia ichthyophaga]
MAQAQDLTLINLKHLLQFLDRHLSLPLVNHLTELGIYSQSDLVEAQYELVKNTNMVDYMESLKPGNPENPDKSHLIHKQEDFEATSAAIRRALEDQDIKSQISSHDNTKNCEILTSKFNLPVSSFEVLYEYGTFQFSCGNYTAAAEYFYHYRLLSTNSTTLLSSLWGLLASNILKGSFDDALSNFNTLRESIDRQQNSQDKGTVVQLQQRTWLLHWGLFIFFNHPQGRDLLVDLLSHTAYLNTLQTACPWLLRYYATAVIVTSRNSPQQSKLIRDLVRVVTIEHYQYTDPITKLIDALYTHFDFTQVEKHLKDTEKVFVHDFFLSSHHLKQVFFNNIRFYITHAYCRIHSHVSVAEVANKVGLNEASFLQWLSEQPEQQNDNEKAFIVASDNTIHIPHNQQSIVTSILDRSAAIALRSQSIKNALDSALEYPPTPSADVEVK